MVRPMVVPLHPCDSHPHLRACPRPAGRQAAHTTGGRLICRIASLHEDDHPCGLSRRLMLETAITKSDLRKALRKARREHVAAQPDMVRALLFNVPPRPILPIIEAGATIGLYHATEFEAPTNAYARFFQEAGHKIALPFFASETAAMEFREHTDPFAENDLEAGPFGLVQPGSDANLISPDVVFVPLVGFTQRMERLGQGGGHYDRWLAAHPEARAIGLAWDVQLCDELPLEPHDRTLDAVITPTRMYGLD